MVLCVLAVLYVFGVAGCTVSVRSEEGSDMSVTWQEAKAQTQVFEKELITLFSSDDVRLVEQKEKGHLMSCSRTEHSWSGGVRVYLREGWMLRLL